MIACVRWISVLGVFSLALVWAWAGDAGAGPGPNSAEFDRQFREWKGVLAQLVRLRDDYRASAPAQREELEKRYDEMVKQSEGTVSALRAAAEAAYLEAPSADSYPAEFLVATMEQNCHEDAHEEAFRLAKLLTDHGYDRRDIYGCTGIEAFAVNEFDLAEKWLRIAKESNSLSRYRPPWNEIAVRALNSCPICRKAWEKEQAIRAAEAKADKSPETWLPRVLLKTNKGEIELELFENEAPNAVANFVANAADGVYNKLPFYTVVAGAWAEAGGLVLDGKVYPLPLYGCERPSRAHFRGSVTMTTPVDDRGVGNSQFSILFLPKPSLNGKNTCIGRVVRGMEVLSRLQRISPEQFDDVRPDGILEAKVLRKRNHAYELRQPPVTPKPTPKPPATPTPKPPATPTPKP